MYSPTITNSVLDDFEMREGWRPVEHSIGEVQEMNEYIASIIDVDENQARSYYDFRKDIRLTERRKQEIKRWVTNEQFMCFSSARYFAEKYAFICDEQGDILKFHLRKSQEIFIKILEEFDELQVAIEIFLVKSRQVGISTAVAILFLHRLLFVPHTQGVMASVSDKQSGLLSRIMDTCWLRLPFWLTPSKVSTKASQPEWSNGSVMSIQSGKQAVGIAQGWTPILCHVSEIADIPNPKKVLEEGLFRAVHSTRKTFFVMEGTGAEASSWQADKWKYYKENWRKGGRFCPTFIPWMCADDLYPEPDWLRAHPIPELWRPLDETLRMKHRGELYMRSNPELSRVMGERWEMPRQQQWFWECNYREALASHTTKVWMAQMPVSDMESFQNKHDLVFADEVIEVATEKRKMDYQPYAITGQSVMIGQNDLAITREKFFAENAELVDFTKEIIPVSWKCRDSHRVSWELVPLLPFDDSDDRNCLDKLLVFHPPKRGADYSIGIDTADGLGMPDEDRSCLSTVLNRQGNQRDEQVCEFSSLHLNPAQMVSIAACVAAWYGQWESGRAGTKDARGAKFIIEQRDRPGDDCQHQLKLLGFFWHHIFDRIDKRTSTKKDQGTQLGWMTNIWSRPWLLNKFVDAVVGGWLKVNSPMLIRQMGDWVRKIDGGGRSKMDHQSGKHDDCIFPTALAYLTAHSHEVVVSRQTSRYARNEDELPVLNEGWCEGQSVSI